MDSFLAQDLPALVTVSLACVTCGVVGNFLLLRQQILLGDAFSHAVFPGIIIAFLVTGSISPIAMTIGALAAAWLGSSLIEALRHWCRLDYGAAMGIVFTTFFAFGVVLLESIGATGVHLDINHALYGNLEGVIWPQAVMFFSPDASGNIGGWNIFQSRIWAHAPHEMVYMAVIFVVNLSLIGLFYKELTISTFDPVFAAGVGIGVRLVSVVFIMAITFAAVAAFSAIGSLLVVAMFVAPGAIAARFCRRLPERIWLSAIVAVLIAVSGYGAAVAIPAAFDAASLNAAAMIAVVAGLFHVGAIIGTPDGGAYRR